MYDPIQHFPLLLVFEDDITQSSSIEGPVVKEDFRTKMGDERGESVGSRCNGISSEEVEVDQGNVA